MNAFSDQDMPVPPGDAQRHEDRFRDRAGTVVEAGIGHVETSELANQRLELKKCLKASLTCLRLVRSVGSVVFTAARDRIHDRWNEMVIAAAAQETNALVRG